MKETEMTFGEKLKSARKSAGLTQEQLADKLLVSRQAVTKWESDKGMPDIENLRQLSQLLGVSIDYLIDNGEQIDFSVTKEPINLDSYNSRKKSGRQSKKVSMNTKHKIVREKFPNAEIRLLAGVQKSTRSEKIIGNVFGFFTLVFGLPEFINAVKNVDKIFYLVNDSDAQYFVTITDEFIETRKLSEKITQKKFEMGNFTFYMCKYLVP